MQRQAEHMDYEIIATLGPKSSSRFMWESLLQAGATAFRLNTSHLSAEQMVQWLESLRPFIGSQAFRPRIVLDLQGSKWRLGDFPEFSPGHGRVIELIHAASTDLPATLPVPHQDFFQAAQSSDGTIVLNDAKVTLVVERVDGLSMKARVARAGPVSSRRGITYLSTGYRTESLSDRDREVVDLARDFDFIRYAVSYVKDGAEMSRYRAVIGDEAYVIAKLERETALEEAGRIALFSDELWLCRGDLGAEMGQARMAAAACDFSARAGSMPLPVMLAGQVLEHMTVSPVPTRSEVCYLHDALQRGYKGVVLSDETAIGMYPVESCRVAAMFRDSSS